VARILGNPFGELRGKAGGSVFSRNKAGQFMRVYVRPTQANSVAQVNARISFGDASQSFSSLNQFLKSGWQTFATSVYNPLRKTNVGQYSSQQAYIGINQSRKTSSAKTIITEWKTLDGVTVIPATSQSFINSNYAPSFTVVGTVTGTGTAGPIPMFATDIAITALGNLAFKLNFGTTGVGKAAGDLVDSNGKPFAIGFYLSNPLKFDAQVPKNKYFMFLGNTNIPNFTTNLPDGTLGISVTNWEIPYLEFKQWLVAGNWVAVTVLAIGNDGTQVRISEQYVQAT